MNSKLFYFQLLFNEPIFHQLLVVRPSQRRTFGDCWCEIFLQNRCLPCHWTNSFI